MVVVLLWELSLTATGYKEHAAPGKMWKRATIYSKTPLILYMPT